MVETTKWSASSRTFQSLPPSDTEPEILLSHSLSSDSYSLSPNFDYNDDSTLGLEVLS